MSRASRRRRYRARQRVGPHQTIEDHPCVECGERVIGTWGICIACRQDHRGTWGQYRPPRQSRWGRGR